MASGKKITDKTKKILVYTLVPVIVVLLAALVVLTRPASVMALTTDSENPGVISTPQPLSTPQISASNTSSNTAISVPAVTPTPANLSTKPQILGRLCLVLDDTGYSLENVQSFLDINIPLTFAILPDLKYTNQSASLISSYKEDYIIHQPMEAAAGDDPGEGAIYNRMTKDEIIAVLEKNYAQQPKAAGMNNHMGSAVTANLDTMNVIFGWLKAKGLFFLDSYTTADSKAALAAANFGMEIQRRDVFLDNDKDYQSIKVMVEKSMELALKQKKALAIGHVGSVQLAKVLADMKTTFERKGIELVSLDTYRKLP
jgi:polysaccharide deacetylase 2 family uncharacterized protein YibQ